ncbi:hypothetical protein FA95DRAFT_1681673 [Auriscalpium vulgare]|uniref:Uncharacterized protein n=1 Tax=Auriscalpium vulgare TaxID=40419 RepID=A0ACB8RJD7_9AGAM|nr:hypothetical protein FA95DRAFT_1681673 [Auriscalpium vulgare]
MISETKSDRELARTSVVGQICTLNQQLADLNSALNDTLPISLLPNEILARILLEVADATRLIIHIGPARPWTPILYVCRRWTSCALATPALWAHIVVRSLDWFADPRTRTHLARAGSYPLTCYMGHVDTSNVAYARAFLSDHGRRVRTVSIVGTSEAVEGLFAGVQDLPILERLQLDKPIFSGGTACLFPEQLLRAGAAPRLSVVDLQGVQIRSWGLFANLTELHVVMRNTFPQPFVPLPELLDSLAQSPGLRALSLSDVLSQDADTLASLLQHRPPVPSTELPALERLDISESCHGIGALLSSLAIPPTVELHLVPLSVHTGREVKYFTHPLRRILRRADRPLMRALAVAFTFNVTLVLHRMRVLHESDSGSGVQVRMDHRVILPQRVVRTTALRILDAFPLEGVVDVDCAGMPRTLCSRATWRAIFSRLPRAARLYGGADEAMLNMVGGLLDVLRSGPQASKSTLKQRNRILQHTGKDSSPSVHLSILCSTGPVCYGYPYSISARLEELLAQYREAHAGQVWDELELLGKGVPLRTRVLGPLARRLLIGTTVWTPEYEGVPVLAEGEEVGMLAALALEAAVAPTTAMVPEETMQEAGS